MAYASRAGKARANARHPRAFAVCDRCGIWFNHDTLRWQFEWRGVALQNIRLLVCDHCYDTPQEQNRAITLPADPEPVMQPRTEAFIEAERGSYTGASVGPPLGLAQGAVMPWVKGVAYGVPIPLASVTADGSTTVTAVSAAPHGLATNGQIAINGLARRRACGFYTVAIVDPVTFTYVTAQPVTAGAILTPTTLCTTAQVGLPYESATIPVA